MQRRRTLTRWGALWVFACLVRAAYLWEIRETPFWTVLMGDALSYDTWAKQLAAGDWLGEAVFYQAPLYPYFLGAIYTAFGPNQPSVGALTAVRVVQVCLGSTACVLIAVAGARFFSRRIGLLCGVLLALYPPAIFFDGLIQKGSLSLFLSCLLLAVLGGLAGRPANRRTEDGQRTKFGRLLFASGVVLGLLTLTRENALVLAVVVAVWVLLDRRLVARSKTSGSVWNSPVSRRALRALILLGGLAVVLLPVAVRNRFVGGEWHLTTSQFGPNFYIGNNRQADGTYQPLKPDRGDPRYEQSDAAQLAEAELGRPLSHAEVSRYWTRRTLGEIRGDPWSWSKLMLRKWRLIFHATEAGDTEDQYTYCESSRLLAGLTRVFHFGVLFPLAVFGVSATWRHRRRLWLPYWMIVAYAASVSLFYVFARYRLPLVPPLMLFAGAGLYRAVSMIRRRRLRQLALCAAIACLAAVPSNLGGLSRDAMRSTTHLNLAVNMNLQGRATADVLSQFRQAVALLPDDVSARMAMADFLYDRRRFADAFEEYRAALDHDSDHAEAHYGAGTALWKLKRPRQAEVHLRRAVEIEPDNYDYRFELGSLLLEEGDAVGALAQLDVAWQIDVNDPLLQRELGRALLRLGNPAAAAEHLRAALAEEPDSVVTRLALAGAYSKLGDMPAAVEELRRVLGLIPADSELAGKLRGDIRKYGDP